MLVNEGLNLQILSDAKTLKMKGSMTMDMNIDMDIDMGEYGHGCRFDRLLKI